MARISDKPPITTVRPTETTADAKPIAQAEPRPDAFGGAGQIEAADVASVQTQEPAFATSPLAARLGLPKELEGPLRSALKNVLGVDVPALRGMSLEEIERGELVLDFNVRAGETHKVPFEGKELRFDVPESEYGIVGRLRVDVGKNADGEPMITGMSFAFENVACSLITRAPRMTLNEFPKLKNPSALQEPMSFTDKLTAPIKDALADVRVQGFEVNQQGQIHITADVDIAGISSRDFHQMAKDQLPTLDMRLASLANLAAAKDPPAEGSSVPSVRQVKHWVEEFARVAYGVSWKAELKTKQGDFLSHGDAEVKDDIVLQQRTSLTVSAPGGGRAQHLNLRVQRDKGKAHLSAGESPRSFENPGVGFKMTKQGLEIDGVDVDALLPVDLKTWGGPGEPPRVGTPEFAARLGDLLDEAAPLRRNQEVEFFRDGNDVLNERVRLCDAAGPGDVLLMQTFIFADDTTGSQVVDALIRAKERGADVRVMIDPVGSLGEMTDLVEGSAAFNRLRAAGVDAQMFQDPTVAMGDTLDSLRGLLAKHPDLEQKLRASGADLVAEAATVLRKTDPETLVANPLAAMTVAPAIARLAAAASDEDSPLPAELIPALQTISEETDSQAILAELIRSLGRDHRKQTLLLGEGKAEMLMGGNNIEDTYQLETDSPHYDPDKHGDLHLWNDAHARIRGVDTVLQSARAFARTWSWQHMSTDAPVIKPPDDATLSGDASLRLIHHRPIGTVHGNKLAGDNHYTNTLLAVLEGAGPGDEVNIENPYFIPQPEVLEAMLVAARRGAKLRIVTNGPHENNDAIPIAEHARRFVFPKLIESGAEIFVTRPDADPIHRKTLVVKTAGGKNMYIMGSQNLDSMSTRINREMTIVGGNAASGGDEPMDAIARGLLEDMERDTDPSVSERASARVVDDDPVDRAASVYLQSVLVPIL
jgi:phosphatidylserine/phosphatidylglycerophosphate/cardiolipin synthase-like enzyme